MTNMPNIISPVRTNVHDQLLLDAVRKNSPDIVDQQLAVGADVNFTKGEPLRVSLTNGYLNVFDRLIAAKADVKVINDSVLMRTFKKAPGNTQLNEGEIRLYEDTLLRLVALEVDVSKFIDAKLFSNNLDPVRSWFLKEGYPANGRVTKPFIPAPT